MPERPSIPEPEVRPASLHTALEVLTEDQTERSRTECSVCGDPQEWYRLEPGTGRCTACQT